MIGIYESYPLVRFLACVAGGSAGAREIKFWHEVKRAAKPREIPPARELGYFECRPLLSAN